MTQYSLTTEGIKKAEEMEAQLYGDTSYNTPLAEVVDTKVPVSDGVVHLDHNSNPYKKAATSLDEAIEELDKLNEPQARKALAKLKAVREILQAPEIDEEDMRIIQKWLEWCGEKYPNIERVIRLLASIKILFGG